LLALCYATNAHIPLAGCDGSKTIAEMHLELKKHYNCDHVDNLKLDEVGAYKNCEEQVPFPVYCSSQIDHPTQWTIVADVSYNMVI
jgi:hypothetical protein